LKTEHEKQVEGHKTHIKQLIEKHNKTLSKHYKAFDELQGKINNEKTTETKS